MSLLIPVDALAIHDNTTYPGVVLTCRPLGVVDVSQTGDKGTLENPRLIVVPTWYSRLGKLLSANGLLDRMRQEIEQFFVSATFFTGCGPEEPAKLKGREVRRFVYLSDSR